VLPDLLGAAARGASARAAARGVTVAVHNPLDNATRHAPSGSVVEVNATANGT
jgi:hypothetical protein